MSGGVGAIEVVVGMASSEQIDALVAMISSVVETQKAHTAQNEAHEKRLVELTESQALMHQPTHELREGQHQLQAQIQTVSAGMTTLHTKTAEMEARFEALKLQVRTGGPADEDVNMSGDKKRKVAAQPAQPVGQSSQRASTPRVVYAGTKAGSSGDAPRGGNGGGGDGHRDGGDGGDIKCRFVVKRMPQVMKGRLPSLLPGLYEFLGDDLVKVQGAMSSSAFTFVVSSASVVDRVLAKHKIDPFMGKFGEGDAVPLVVMPDRPRWVQKLLTMEWPVIQHLKNMSGVEDASMNKFRDGARRGMRIYVRPVGKEIFQLVGTGYYREVSELGPEPNEWLSFEPAPEFVEAAGGIREAMSLARDA